MVHIHPYWLCLLSFLLLHRCVQGQRPAMNDNSFNHVKDLSDIFCTESILLSKQCHQPTRLELLEDCLHICLNRRPMMLQFSRGLGTTLAEDERDKTPITAHIINVVVSGSDRVTNMTFAESPTDKRAGYIYFTRPHTNYDLIALTCEASDQVCSNEHRILRSNATNSSGPDAMLLFPIIRGVAYRCDAKTIQGGSISSTSDTLLFKTALEPVLYDGLNIFNGSTISLNTIPQSDFAHVQLVCYADPNLSCVWPFWNRYFSYCQTAVMISDYHGCDYECYFMTSKTSYGNCSSNKYRFKFLPAKPIISLNQATSRWISVVWSVHENTSVHSFDLFLNDTSWITIENWVWSYNWTGLLPDRVYKFSIRLNANSAVWSDPVYLKTSQEAPGRPTDYEVNTKVIPQDDHPFSTAEQYVVEIDLSLFSHDNGFVYQYLIYVRQDQTNYQLMPIINGTYGFARIDRSVDYLAVIILLNSSLNRFGRMLVLLGNDTRLRCTPPCNGKLRPNSFYKILVGGCSNTGCTYVLSRPFRTKNLEIVYPTPVPWIPHSPPDQSTRSIAWVAVFPSVAFVVILALAIWKRKALKSYCCRKETNKEAHNAMNDQDVDPTIPAKPSVPYTCPAINPKLLTQYINLTDEDKNNLTVEFQKLQELSPKYTSSSNKCTNSLLDRYDDVPARGPWSATAVRLTGTHRSHDYINANEIRGVNGLKQYIACQGPKENTIEDFWDMIIQYQVTTIVMLSRFDQTKCFPYIPTNKNQSMRCGRLQVKLKSTEHHLENQLEMRHIAVKEGDKEYHVVHYLFIGWSGFSVIDSEKLIDLIELVNQHSAKTTMPIVVHCSSGTDRTGTYIATDIVIHLLNQPNTDLSRMELDIMGIVNQLKQERTNMVQTPKQYQLIHRCVEVYLRKMNRLSSITRESVAYETIADENLDSNKVPYVNLPDSRSSYLELHAINPQLGVTRTN